VQRGDLTDGTLAELLQTLSTAQVTGALHVRAALAAIRVPNENAETPPGADPLAELEADEAVVYLRNGEVYSARAPGPRPLLGTRLVTEGIITRQALAEALETQAGALSGWRLGELLVHLGYVEPESVEAFVHEQTVDAMTRIRSWPAGDWQLRRGERTRETSGTSLNVSSLLEEIATRERITALLIDTVGTASDVLVASPPESEVELDLLSSALLRATDGKLTLAQIAISCGLTIYEASRRLAPMAESGWIRVDAPLRNAHALVAARTMFGSSSAFGASPAFTPPLWFGPAPAPVDERTKAADEELELLQDRSRAAAAAELASTQAETEAEHWAQQNPAVEIDPVPADADELAWLGTMAREVEEARYAAETRLHADTARLSPDTQFAPDTQFPPDTQFAQEPELEGRPAPAAPMAELAPMLSADHRAALAAALSEVAASSPAADPAATDPAAATPDQAPAIPEPMPAALRARRSHEPLGMLEPRPETVGRPVTDTASLLRELASLGMDDEPTSAHAGPAPRAPARPATRPPQGGKKPRKGLFGR